MADATAEQPGPNKTSSDYDAMAPYWRMVEAILGGAEAMRAAGETYLPKFEGESPLDYEHRRKSAPFTNVYSDVSKNLASKPFARELALNEGSWDQIEKLSEDIDGQGNSLHVFAESVFQRGIDKGVDWIFVDHTRVQQPEGRPPTVAEEKAQGARPYWVHVPAERMLAVYSGRENGQEVITHARIHEPAVERDGYGEVTYDRVRVLNRETLADGTLAPATYEVLEKQTDTNGKETWVTKEGPAPLTIGVIALAPFAPGKRKGASWQFVPPLRDIAYMQVDEFQQESNLKNVLELTAYPMLAGNGIGKPVDSAGKEIRVPVGPRAVLFAPMGSDGKFGEWKFIEPAGSSIDALEKHLEASQNNMRDLGMQPLTKANLTVITTANVAMKAHSAVQAWAIQLKDALEQALKFTAMWLGDESKAPEADVYTDFGVDFEAGTELESLLKAEGQGVISRRTTQEEFKRRGVLSDSFDTDEEEERLALEGNDAEDEELTDPRMGLPLNAPPIAA